MKAGKEVQSLRFYVKEGYNMESLYIVIGKIVLSLFTSILMIGITHLLLNLIANFCNTKWLVSRMDKMQLHDIRFEIDARLKKIRNQQK